MAISVKLLALRRNKNQFIIGIDEVGRGSLAGPVVVAAAAISQGVGLRVQGLAKLKDSKQLSEKQREEWFRYFQKHPDIRYAVAWVYPKAIDRINISRAANLAAFRSFARLSKTHNPAFAKWLRTPACRQGRGKLNPKRPRVFLDGGLYIKNASYSKSIGAKTVVKGDEKITAVAIASIVAKVSRDRAMKRLGKQYRVYGFEIHKGYGTKYHMRAIRKYGPSDAHRLTFAS